MSALRTLEFGEDDTFHYRAIPYSYMTLCLSRALKSSALRGVEQISFRFARLENNQETDELVEWPLLDEILADPGLGRLERVVFWICKEEARLAVRDRLPKLRSKRILCFEP